MKRQGFASMMAITAFTTVATAENVTVEVTNNQPTGGFSITPLWAAFHDGTFDAFDAGSAASPGIEDVAELGMVGALSGEFAGSGVDGVVVSPDAPPPFVPGETGSMLFDVGDASVNRFFSFASMLIPSNDLFLGNDDPMAYEVFDADGNFNGPLSIQIFSNDVWDAGTELNDISNGPAFIVGQDATGGTTEDGVIRSLFSVEGVEGYLASIVGQETPIGAITDGLSQGELIATVSIIPEPAFMGIALVGMTLALRRRSR